jgi:hypothetical protein
MDEKIARKKMIWIEKRKGKVEYKQTQTKKEIVKIKIKRQEEDAMPVVDDRRAINKKKKESP